MPSVTPPNFDQSDAPRAIGEHLLPDPLPSDPFPLFKSWFDKAHTLKVQPNPNAMTLATVGPDNKPSARIVLCKSIDPAGGHIIFYTNDRGRKGRELAANPRAAAVFHWDALDTQVRLEGVVAQSPTAESDAYFRSRPWISKVGAWASDQSEPIVSRAALEEKAHAAMRRFGIDPLHPPAIGAPVEIPRPPHWSGYRLHAERIELWCAGRGRLHDRAVWTRTLKAGATADESAFAAATTWRSTRLQP